MYAGHGKRKGGGGRDVGSEGWSLPIVLGHNLIR